MKCLECEEKLSAYIDQMLAPEEEKEVEEHLETCPACKENLIHLKTMIEGINTFQEKDPPTDLHQKIIERIVKETQLNKTTISRTYPEKKGVTLQSWIKYGGSAAAVILIAVIVVGSLQMGIMGRMGSSKDQMSAEMAEAKMSIEAPDSERFSTDEAPQVESTENKAIADESSLPAKLEKDIEGTMQIQTNNEEENDIEKWEIQSFEKGKIVQAVKDYITLHRIEAEFLPSETKSESIWIKNLDEKQELFDIIINADKKAEVIKSERRTKDLKIIFK